MIPTQTDVADSIPSKVWNRGLRAGGVTEGGQAGATIEDRAKLAGHSNPKITAEVYDRDRPGLTAESQKPAPSTVRAAQERDRERLGTVLSNFNCLPPLHG
jgi:hypothetical protein